VLGKRTPGGKNTATKELRSTKKKKEEHVRGTHITQQQKKDMM
jgi:hypothetical protein